MFTITSQFPFVSVLKTVTDATSGFDLIFAINFDDSSIVVNPEKFELNAVFVLKKSFFAFILKCPSKV